MILLPIQAMPNKLLRQRAKQFRRNAARAVTLSTWMLLGTVLGLAYRSTLLAMLATKR